MVDGQRLTKNAKNGRYFVQKMGKTKNGPSFEPFYDFLLTK